MKLNSRILNNFIDKISIKINKIIAPLHLFLINKIWKNIQFYGYKFLDFIGVKKAALPIYLGVGIVAFLLISYYQEQDFTKSEKAGIEAAVENYKDEVDKYAKKLDLPSSYLMAVIMLECSGRKTVPPRFEQKIYKKLKSLKNKEITKFENLTYETVDNATDDALRNLASSWGPFQLMGYKCTFLDIEIKDMRGDEAIYWGVKWINETYGEYLKAGKYKDAFHIHNTGKEYPATGKPFTYDPDYVEKGLHYMKYFEKLDSLNN